MDTFDLITTITVIFGLVISIFNFLHNTQVTCAKERMDQVIAPMFKELELYMFADGKTELSTAEIQRIQSIYYESKTVAGGKLCSFFFDSFNEPIKYKKDTKKLCKIIDREYDRLCLVQGIPLRTFSYRIKHYRKGYKIVHKEWYEWLAFVLRLLLSIMCIIALGASVILFLENQNSLAFGCFAYSSVSLLILIVIFTSKLGE